LIWLGASEASGLEGGTCGLEVTLGRLPGACQPPPLHSMRWPVT
jgi:hypothetical protein